MSGGVGAGVPRSVADNMLVTAAVKALKVIGDGRVRMEVPLSTGLVKVRLNPKLLAAQYQSSPITARQASRPKRRAS